DRESKPEDYPQRRTHVPRDVVVRTAGSAGYGNPPQEWAGGQDRSFFQIARSALFRHFSKLRVETGWFRGRERLCHPLSVAVFHPGHREAQPDRRHFDRKGRVARQSAIDFNSRAAWLGGDRHAGRRLGLYRGWHRAPSWRVRNVV